VTMFYYLNGVVAEMEANLAVIDCGGVGYACATTNYTLSQLKKGERAKLYTYMNVREDAVDLFGFSSQSELHSFKLLLGVSGVGPKAALAILSTNTPANLAMAVVMGDEKALTAAPGIGKKIAQRIILELKDKLAKEQASFGPDTGGSVPLTVLPNDKAKEAGAALAVLGYSGSEVAAALKGIDIDTLPLEEIIRQALKRMVK
jgi:Holliday junction DNA helicase RuvA